MELVFEKGKNIRSSRQKEKKKKKRNINQMKLRTFLHPS